MDHYDTSSAIDRRYTRHGQYVRTIIMQLLITIRFKCTHLLSSLVATSIRFSDQTLLLCDKGGCSSWPLTSRLVCKNRISILAFEDKTDAPQHNLATPEMRKWKRGYNYYAWYKLCVQLWTKLHMYSTKMGSNVKIIGISVAAFVLLTITLYGGLSFAVWNLYIDSTQQRIDIAKLAVYIPNVWV